MIEVRRADNRGRGGRGVFARENIPAGTHIERVPVLLIPHNHVFSDNPDIRAATARISWYVFDWEGINKRHYVALALGYGSIYNHSDNPNARFDPVAPDLLDFFAIKDIAKDEEILINYQGKSAGQHPLGFEPQ